jgi:uncharacterized membrane protein
MEAIRADQGTAVRHTALGRDGRLFVNLSQTERFVSLGIGGALAVYGLARRSPADAALAMLGGALVARGATGHCPFYSAAHVNEAAPGALVHLEAGITINRPRAELFAFWRALENLPRFMPHVRTVRDMGEGRSHWVVRGPAGRDLSWDAEIVAEKPNALITWRSLPGSGVSHTGSIRFTGATGGRGTELSLTMEYDPPAGPLGAVVARLLGDNPEQQIHEDLRRFKQLMEAGEIPTTDGQPAAARRLRQE